MSDVILCNLSDANKVVAEARIDWIYDVLEALEVSPEVLDFADIRDFRYDMDMLGIEVELISNGDINVYKKQWHEGDSEETSGWLPVTDDHLVAQWKTPTYVRRIDGKDMYYEVHLNEWSILNMR
jgi:hypothetical protein